MFLVSSPMPFGGEAFQARSLWIVFSRTGFRSPMPFGGEAFQAPLKKLKKSIGGLSPMPFGGEAFQATGIRGKPCARRLVSNAFRR